MLPFIVQVGHNFGTAAPLILRSLKNLPHPLVHLPVCLDRQASSTDNRLPHTNKKHYPET